MVAWPLLNWCREHGVGGEELLEQAVPNLRWLDFGFFFFFYDGAKAMRMKITAGASQHLVMQ